jgi:hypothetical protein
VDENTGDCSNLVLLNAPIHSRPPSRIYSSAAVP